MSPDPHVPTPTPIPTGDRGGPGRPPKEPRDKDEKQRKRLMKGVKAGRFGFDKEAVRAVIERWFRVYEERDAIPGLDQAVLVAFYVMSDRAAIEERYPDLQAALKELDPQLMPVLREEGGETIIVVTRRAEASGPAPRLPIVLFVATLITLTLAGSIAALAYEGSIEIGRIIEPYFLGQGFLWFALPLAVVFAVQELARRFVAARHGMQVGFSYWIPVPPFVFFPSIGTFGTVQHAREPYPDRKAMFDLSAAAPLAGFLVAIPIVALGFLMTSVGGVALPDDARLDLSVEAPDGTTWTEGDGGLFDPFDRSTPDDTNRAHNVTVRFERLIGGRGLGTEGWNATGVRAGAGGDPVDATLSFEAYDAAGDRLAAGEVTDAVAPEGRLDLGFDVPADTDRLVVVLEYRVPDRTSVPLGEPLAFMALGHYMADDDLLLHPLGLAGWTALLVVGITLIPAGRLDGGGIARALFGERAVIVGYIALGALAVQVFMYPGWLYLVLFIILFLGVRHPAALNETVRLNGGRRMLALLLVLVLVVSFIPVPAEIAGL